MRDRPRVHVLVCAGVAAAAVGCIHYHPQPISPSESLAAFSARTLDDPSLLRFLEANGEAGAQPGGSWDLARLTLAAFYFSPDLAVARAELASARAAAVSAGARENPLVALSGGYDTTTPVRSISPWILGFNLDIPLTTAGKRRHRIARAENLAEAARFGLASVAWQVRSRVRAALVDLYSAGESERLLGEQEGVLRENVAVLERQLAVGEVSPADVTQARIALASARVALADAAARRASARARLADAMGIPGAALDRVSVTVADLERSASPIPSAEARGRAVLNRADVLAALAEYAASQDALQLEIARQYPDVHLGPGYEFDQGEHKWFLALSLPVPVVNRNRGPIAEAEAARTVAAARFNAVQAHALGEVDGAAAVYGAAPTAAAAAEGSAGDLEKRERAARARFEAGEISRLELGGARLERVSGELALLEARVKAQESLGELEDAMQCPAQAFEPEAPAGGTREPSRERRPRR